MVTHFKVQHFNFAKFANFHDYTGRFLKMVKNDLGPTTQILSKLYFFQTYIPNT